MDMLVVMRAGARSTRGRIWCLLYAERYASRQEAMSREWYLNATVPFGNGCSKRFRIVQTPTVRSPRTGQEAALPKNPVFANRLRKLSFFFLPALFHRVGPLGGRSISDRRHHGGSNQRTYSFDLGEPPWSLLHSRSQARILRRVCCLQNFIPAA